MFFLHHPKPFLQKAVAVQIAERRLVPLPDNTVLIIEKPEPAVITPEAKR